MTSLRTLQGHFNSCFFAKVSNFEVLFFRMMARKLNTVHGIHSGRSWPQQSWVALATSTSGLLVKCCTSVLPLEQLSVMCQTLWARYRLFIWLYCKLTGFMYYWTVYQAFKLIGSVCLFFTC